MLLLDSLAMNPTPKRAVWIMRQAGRYLADFRAMRKQYAFDEMALNPELAAKASLLPMKKYDLDASIVFSDILYPLRALGVPLQFTEKGPELGAPKNLEELNALRTSFDPMKDTSAIMGAIRIIRSELSTEKAVLGFAGAPFTMLCYLLEGKLTKDLGIVKKWMAQEEAAVLKWLKILAQLTGEYLDAQAQSGADAVQLFDTWAGQLSPADYEKFALPFAREALSAVTVPSIYYCNGVSGVLESISSVGAQALSIDWRMNLKDARKRVPPVTALQGNLDPFKLLLPKHQIREEVFKICESYGRGPGHIVNLGHGIVPGIPEEAVETFVSAAHEWK